MHNSDAGCDKVFTMIGRRWYNILDSHYSCCLYLLNIWEFVYFVWGLSPPKRRIVQWRNFAHRRVTTMCRTCVGFYVYRGRRYENDDIFLQNACM